MLKNFFKNEADDQFIRSLTEKIERRFPSSVAKKRAKTLNTERIGDIFEQILTEALIYKRNVKPNFFRKARMANLFKWGLLEAGYPPEFADSLTKGMVIYMAKK